MGRDQQWGGNPNHKASIGNLLKITANGASYGFQVLYNEPVTCSTKKKDITKSINQSNQNNNKEVGSI